MIGIRRGIAAATLVLVLAACGREADEPAAAPTPAPRETLPADGGGVEVMGELYARELRALGVRLTRSALVDRSGGGFEYDPEATHLALYVEPIEEATTRDAVERIMPLTELFASTVFDRWPGLESFDVCQEPHPTVDDSPEPPPVTQVDMVREGAAGIDWDRFGLVDLLVLSHQAHPEEGRQARVITSREVAAFPAYRAALEEAAEIVEAAAG